MNKRQRRGTRFSKDGRSVFVRLQVDRRHYEFARHWADFHGKANPAGTAEDHLEGYLNMALTTAIDGSDWEAPEEVEALYGPQASAEEIEWKGRKMRVPAEYVKPGKLTPEDAADYASDIIGFMAISRSRQSMEQCRKAGRGLEADFYEAMIALLQDWYENKPGESADEP